MQFLLSAQCTFVSVPSDSRLEGGGGGGDTAIFAVYNYVVL